MHRTQILLENRQYQKMKSLAEKEGRSLSSLVREAVAAFLERGRTSPATTLAEITGIGEDPDCRGRDHDAVVYRPARKR